MKPFGQTLYAFAAVLLVSSAFLSFAGWCARRSLRKYTLQARRWDERRSRQAPAQPPLSRRRRSRAPTRAVLEPRRQGRRGAGLGGGDPALPDRRARS